MTYDSKLVLGDTLRRCDYGYNEEAKKQLALAEETTCKGTRENFGFQYMTQIGRDCLSTSSSAASIETFQVEVRESLECLQLQHDEHSEQLREIMTSRMDVMLSRMYQQMFPDEGSSGGVGVWGSFFIRFHFLCNLSSFFWFLFLFLEYFFCFLSCFICYFYSFGSFYGFFLILFFWFFLCLFDPQC